MKQQSVWRRAGLFATVSLLVAAVVAIAPSSAGAEDDFITGSGTAQARLLRAGPAASQLALAPVIGLSLSDYLNTVGRGDARVFEWGALDGSIPDELKDASPSVRVTSNDEGSESGKDGSFAGAPAGSPISAGVVQQHADASKKPLGHSVVKLAGFAVPGAYELSGGIAETSAGIVKAGTREARATVRIGRLSLGGGAVVLSGLRWESVQRTGADATNTGSFSIDGLQIGGQTLAPPAPDQLDAAFTQMNTALAPTGLVLDAPKASKEGGLATVSPLGIRIINSPVGNTVAGPVVGALQPVREPVTGAILSGPQPPEPLPAFSTATLLADVFAGVATGAGRFDLEVGGVFGYTEGTKYEGYNFDFTSSLGGIGASNDFADGGFGSDSLGSSLPSGASLSSTSLGSSASGAGAGAASAGRTAGTTAGSPQRAVIASATGVKHLGKTGGAAVLVGLVGLLGALALAAADFRAIRMARRTIIA